MNEFSKNDKLILSKSNITKKSFLIHRKKENKKIM